MPLWSLFFFFSSRRRHTRFDCDWSSDVCSSDLSGAAAVRGHSSPISLVQSISGGTRADAVRAVRIGEALLDGVPEADAGGVDAGDEIGRASCRERVEISGGAGSLKKKKDTNGEG